MRYEKGNLLDKKFKAIADNTRWEILLLLKEKPLTAGEIASHFMISFASISYHLEKLEESDLVTSKQFGKHREYSLYLKGFEEVYLWFSNLT